MKIQILTDNRAKKRGILAEHGLSLFIEHKNAKVLFDTGQSFVFLENAGKMGTALEETDCIVLSHGHYDHAGGLVHLLKAGICPKTYIHPGAFAKRYAGKNADAREVGIPWEAQELDCLGKSIIVSDKSRTLHEGVHLLTEVPSITEFEGIPEGFFIEKDSRRLQDMIRDEQMLVCETDMGLTVFLGCSHPGVINCLKRVQNRFPEKPVHALVGGMHLENASPLCLRMTMQHLQDMDIQKVVPLHCTGLQAICEMKRFLGGRCLLLCAGDAFEI